VPIKVAIADYRALAELRYRIRLFLREGDAAARRLGLEPQQYLLFLMISVRVPEADQVHLPVPRHVCATP